MKYSKVRSSSPLPSCYILQRMTAKEGYVWFLPAWYADDWWDVDYYNSPPSHGDNRPQESTPCTTQNMEYAIDGHFILQKTFSDPDDTKVIGDITIGQYKRLYARRVGKAVSFFYSFSCHSQPLLPIRSAHC